jgi:hypothetical protein
MRKSIFLIVIGLILSSFPELYAQKTWDGEGFGVSWSDQASWSNDTRPGPIDSKDVTP